MDAKGEINSTEVKTPESANCDVHIVTVKSKRSIVSAYILGLALGWMGAHHFYLRRPKWGVLYLFTFGLFGVGYVVDLIRMSWLVRRANTCLEEPQQQNVIRKKSLVDAYLLWFPCGFFGAHHFYLLHYGWGFAYLFTFGFLGFGWLMDAFCMPTMVRNFNEKQLNDGRINTDPKPYQIDMVTAYRLCLFPLTGLLGCHHYYLGRTAFGIFYTFTFGGFGFPWIADWFRLSILVKNANRFIAEHQPLGERRLDDLYLMAIPCGLFGAHHFHLKRVGWGFLYLCTLGCFGIGFIIDLFRMPKLLDQYRKSSKQRRLSSGNPETGVTNYGSQDTGMGTPVQYGYDGTQPYMPPNIPGYPEHSLPGYSTKFNGETGVPSHHLPPPAYDAEEPSSFSTIASSNVDGLPSYQDAIRENNLNQQQAEPSLTPTAPTGGHDVLYPVKSL